MKESSFTRTKDPKEFISSVETRYGKFAESLLKAYPVSDSSVPKTARDLSRDAAFGWQTWSWARLQAKTGKSKVFFYYFDQHPDHPKDSPYYGFGSYHGQEVAYVFENLDKSNPQTSKSDLEISNLMGTYWTNFAKYGDPNGKDIPDWPAFSDSNPKLMYFNNTAYTGPVPSAKSLEVLDSYFSWRRSPEGEAWAK